MRQAAGIAVFSGMLGVTVFGLRFRPAKNVTHQVTVDRELATAHIQCQSR
jgi:hypothetical protein